MLRRKRRRVRQSRRGDGFDELRITNAIKKRARKGRQRLALCRLARSGFHYFSRKLAH